jgi:hypothetical protein
MLQAAIPGGLQALFFDYRGEDTRDIGKQLLDLLETERERGNETSKHTIFVAHDSGILIVGKALEQASPAQLSSIIGIVYLASTPWISADFLTTFINAMKSNGMLLAQFYPRLSIPKVCASSNGGGL